MQLFDKFKAAGYHDITFPHRELLLSYVMKYNPKSVLDVGTGSAADLWLIKQTSPEIRLTGIDTSPSPFDGATIIIGRIEEELPKLTEKYDVVMSNGVLMYQRERTTQVLDEMVGLANKAVLLSEINPHGSEQSFDYESYFMDRKLSFTRHKIPSNIREGTEWPVNGYIYEVIL